MINLYIYEKNSGILKRTDIGLAEYVTSDLADDEDFTLTPPPTQTKEWSWNGSEWVKILEPVEVRQAKVWEDIKNERLKRITSGVYVSSIGKKFHTDDVSVIQYNNIGNMIALDNFEPIEWKVMDNTWITMTEDVFKDLQKAMVQNTNKIYRIAEEHKAKMLEMDNPEDYDYSEGW